MKANKIIATSLLVGLSMFSGIGSVSSFANDITLDSNAAIIQEKASPIRPNAYYEGSFTLNGNKTNYYSTKHYPNQSTIGMYFTVSQNGKYSMIDSTTNTPFQDRWSGVQKELYEVVTSPSGEQKLVLVGEKPHKLKYGSVNFNLYTGDPLVADLKAGTQYLLVYNNDGHNIPGLSAMTVRTKFDKLN